ncbi:MAG TPA: DUF3796 domain-containing protein [Halanaerobiales bacterium]|nr:DUF3796 domain-containing protein [Halanaerobiales bacterium]
MKTNWIKYLGLMGIVGLLGLFTSNPSLYGFFGFFGFFGFANIKSDERLEENINKAAKNTFITTLIIFILTIVIGSLASNPDLFIYGLIINFVQHILVFTISFHIYDRG